jgi:ribonuclease HI
MTSGTDSNPGGDRLSVGTYVVDRDATNDPDRAVVVRLPDAVCAIWEIEGTDQTVADYNPDYSSDAPVAIVVFEPALDSVSEWQHSDPDDLWPLVQTHDLPYYAYPEPRLEPVGDALAGHTHTDPVTIWFDGACEPVNPGGHGTYGIVVEQGGEIVHKERGYIGEDEGITNNVAEYEALVAALEHTRAEYPDAPVTVYGDSQLVIRQLTGEYAVRSPRLRPLWQDARRLANQLDVEFEWVPREQNERADALSREAYYEQTQQGELDKRRERAANEPMQITPLGDETYEVKGTYTVDLTARSCTCPDYENRGLPCKHIFKVEQNCEQP